MGIWDKVKAGTKKTRLQGELALMDREITNRKYAFGVELYDVLVADAKKFSTTSGGGSGIGTSFFSQAASIANNSNAHNHGSNKVAQLQQSPELNEPFEACLSDIREMEAQQQSYRNEQEVLQATRMRGEPPSTAGERLAKAGQWVSTNASETKLEAQIKLLDRNIRRRKEQFGLEVYDSYIASGAMSNQSGSLRDIHGGKNNGGGGTMRERLTARMSQLSPKEKRVQECLDRSKNAINLLERQHDMKKKEIESLDEIVRGGGGSTTTGGDGSTAATAAV